MSGPIIADPVPAWLKPENKSVFDPEVLKAMRILMHAIGADDPKSSVLGLMNPMETGPVGGVMGAIGKKIRAYHGSPHDFDKFDMSKIGTGEGAQAYGHGMYFAENPETAMNYRERLSSPRVTIGGQVVNDGGDQSLDIALAHLEAASKRAGTDRSQLFLEARKSLAGAEYRASPESRPNFAAARGKLAELEQAGAEIASPGKMYEVNINADPEHLLDWDKPLSQQPQGTQSAVKLARDKAMGDVRPVRLKDGSYGVTRINADGSGNVIPGVSEATPEAAVAALQREASHGSGQWAYDSLSRTIRKPGAFPEISIPDKAAASKALQEAGIPGIKYLDQGSRQGGEGTSNYVMFDDKTIDILRKWAWILAMGGGAAAAGAQPMASHDQGPK